MAIIIAFLGVGMVAIPTGIISAGFVEQYNKTRQDSATQRELMSTFYDNTHIAVREIIVSAENALIGKSSEDISLPADEILLMIKRGNETHFPSENIILKSDDRLVIFDNDN